MRNVVLIAACMIGASGLSAQTATVDADAVKACLSQTPVGETYPACLGQASGLCQEQPGGSSTVGITECIAAETAVWDDILNAQYQAVRRVFGAQVGDGAALSGEDLNLSLRDAQRAWIAFRDAECALQYDRYRGGTIRSIVGANCVMTMTASRALALRDMAVSP